MKKHYLILVIALLLLLSLNGTANALPLIFKAEREVKAGSPEVVSFDSVKYSQIRFGIIFKPTGAERETVLVISAIEGDAKFDIFFLFLSEKKGTRTDVMEAVPSRLQLTMETPGRYRIFAWGR